ncbi:hypothetical protein AGMMS49942_00760 [Spirochaetia bacterium]|nr:hypothetical protein AGMMS49942_00760 [Spirochaetia bacterium]
MEYYLGRLFLNQDIRGTDKSFRDLQRAYQISLIGKEPLFDDDELVHHFEYYDKEHDMPLGGRTTIITLELTKLDKILEKPVANMSAEERWAVFTRFCGDKRKRGLINELLAAEEGIAMVGQTMRGFTKDQLEYFRKLDEEMYELDKQSYDTELRREGRRKGLEEGREEGLEKGREESRQVIAEKDRIIAELMRKLQSVD